MKVDGVLARARIRTNYRGEYFAEGYIYSDAKGRFADNIFIYTSTILDGPDANGIIKTQNSVYQVVLEEDKS
jgi:hypothetical protein